MSEQPTYLKDDIAIGDVVGWVPGELASAAAAWGPRPRP